MPTDYPQYPQSFTTYEAKSPPMERSRARSGFTACRMTTEVFVNAAAQKPVAAALSGWVPRRVTDDLPAGPARLTALRRHQPMPSVNYSHVAHA